MARPPTPLQQAQAITRAQYAPSDYALGRANAQSKAEQAALAATGAALLKQLQAGVAPGGRTYDAAIGQQQALAQGGANLLASLSPNAQVQSELAAVNAPNAQRAQLAAALQAQYPGQGAVLNIEQGTIPGASLAAERASTQRYLAGLPALAALAEQQSARSLLARAADTRDKLLEQRLGITGQIPQLALNIQQHNQAQALQQAEFANSVRQAALNRQFQAEQSAASRAFNAQQAALGRQLTPYEKAQIAAENQRIAISRQQAQRQAKSGGLTPYQVYESQKQAAANRSKAFESTRTKVEQNLGLLPSTSATGSSIFGLGGGAAAPANSLGVPKRQRQQAYTKLFNLYGPPLLRAGVSRNSVKAMIDTALNQAGYALPGKKTNSRGKRVK